MGPGDPRCHPRGPRPIEGEIFHRKYFTLEGVKGEKTQTSKFEQCVLRCYAAVIELFALQIGACE